MGLCVTRGEEVEKTLLLDERLDTSARLLVQARGPPRLQRPREWLAEEAVKDPSCSRRRDTWSCMVPPTWSTDLLKLDQPQKGASTGPYHGTVGTGNNQTRQLTCRAGWPTYCVCSATVRKGSVASATFQAPRYLGSLCP